MQHQIATVKTDSPLFQERIKVRDSGMASLKCLGGGGTAFPGFYLSNEIIFKSKGKDNSFPDQKKTLRIFFYRKYDTEVVEYHKKKKKERKYALQEIQMKSFFFFFLIQKEKIPRGKHRNSESNEKQWIG